MQKKVHPKMDSGLRAKQFLPFAALKGLEEALEKAEEETQKEYNFSFNNHDSYDTIMDDCEDYSGNKKLSGEGTDL